MPNSSPQHRSRVPGSSVLCPLPLTLSSCQSCSCKHRLQHCTSHLGVWTSKPKFTIAHLISASSPRESQAKIPMPGTLILSSVQHMAAFGVLDLLPHQPRYNNVLWITPPKPFKFFFLVNKKKYSYYIYLFRVCTDTPRGVCRSERTTCGSWLSSTMRT